jgi:hypothetical protein
LKRNGRFIEWKVLFGKFRKCGRCRRFRCFEQVIPVGFARGAFPDARVDLFPGDSLPEKQAGNEDEKQGRKGAVEVRHEVQELFGSIL